MVEMQERELLLQSLKRYLEELRESGVDELCFAQLPVSEREYQSAGNPQPRLLMVLNGPGLAGAAGELLGKIIEAMGFATSEVHLISFGAGSSRAVSPAREQLLARIAELGPEVVVTLGEQAAQLLLATEEPVEKLRGRFHDLAGIPLMPTLHPDAMLENAALKREVWSDMQQVMRRLG